MGRSRIDDSLLTEEQRKRRARNERYRNKVVNISSNNETALKSALRTSLNNEMALKQALKNEIELKNALINETKKEIETEVFEIKENETISNNKEVSKNETVSKVSETAENRWEGFRQVYQKPSYFFLSLSAIVIASILIIFQAQAYLSNGYGWMAWVIAITCELSLMSLTILYSSLKSKMSALLFVGLSIYSLGVMSFDLKDKEIKQVSASQQNNSTIKTLEKSLESTQKALDLAIKRGESGNIAKHTKSVESLTKMLTSQVQGQANSGVASMAAYKANGLMFLRGLLMAILALNIHILINLILKERR